MHTHASIQCVLTYYIRRLAFTAETSSVRNMHYGARAIHTCDYHNHSAVVLRGACAGASAEGG